MDVPIRPCPLGKVVVAAAGTPVRLDLASTEIAALVLASGKPAYGNSNNLDDAWARRIDLKNPGASPGAVTAGNSGRLYFGLKNMDRVTLIGVILFLDPGESYTLENPQQAQPYHLGDYWVDAEVSGEFFTGDFDPS